MKRFFITYILSTIETSLASLTKRSVGIGALLLFTALYVNAQSFTDRLRQHEDGKGTVTITQSAEIEDLVNNAQLTPQAPANTPNAQTPVTPQNNTPVPAPQAQHPGTSTQQPQHQPETTHPTAPSTHESNKNETTKPSSSTSTETETEEPTVDTRKKMMRNSYKTTGYRIQVFSGGNSRADRQKAETAGAVMKSNFPSEPIYVHFYSPSWKCRMGNYKSADEARRILAQVKKLGYSHACIVKGTISVQY